MMIVQQLRSIDSYARWDHFNKQVASRKSQLASKNKNNQKSEIQSCEKVEIHDHKHIF